MTRQCQSRDISGRLGKAEGRAKPRSWGDRVLRALTDREAASWGGWRGAIEEEGGRSEARVAEGMGRWPWKDSGFIPSEMEGPGRYRMSPWGGFTTRLQTPRRGELGPRPPLESGWAGDRASECSGNALHVSHRRPHDCPLVCNNICSRKPDSREPSPPAVLSERTGGGKGWGLDFFTGALGPLAPAIPTTPSLH